MASRADSNRRPLVPRSVSAKTYAVESVDIRPSSPLPATTQAAGRRGQDILGPPPRPAHRDRRQCTVVDVHLSRTSCRTVILGPLGEGGTVCPDEAVFPGVWRSTTYRLPRWFTRVRPSWRPRQGRFFGSQDCCPDRTSSALTPSTLLRAYLPATNARTRTTLAMGAPAAAQLRQTNTRTLASSPTPYGTCSGDAALWRVTLVSRATPGLRMHLCYGVK